MSYYEKNKKVISEYYPDLFDRLEEEVKKDFQVETIETRDGNHALLVEKEGKKYRLNSAYRPLEEAKKWVERFELKNLSVNAFMFGLGNGYFIRELLRHAGQDAGVYVWEPDASIFVQVLEDEDLTDIFENEHFHFYLGEKDFQILRQVMEHVIGWQNYTSQIKFDHICYRSLYEEEYELFFDTVDYVIDMVMTRMNTNVFFAHVAVKNALDNLRYLEESNYITEFIGKIPEDIPAIIVAAGPSLDKNIHLLKEAAGKALIIATDTAVRYLETKNLPYDCMITVDPKKPVWYLSKYPGCKTKPLFCNADGQAGIFSFHEGKKIWSGGSIFLDAFYASFGMFFPQHSGGGSVATSATIVAYHLGIKNIILIGQDLAYGKEHTHAGGFDDEKKGHSHKIQGVTEGIDGEMIPTRSDWQIYLGWYEDFIKMHKEEEVNIIDATEGGALIHGSIVMDFKDAIEKYCTGKKFSFDKLLEEVPSTFETIDFQPFREKLLKMDHGITVILEKAKAGKKESEEFLHLGKKISPKKHDRILKDLKKLNNQISKQEGYEFLDLYSSELMLDGLHDVYQITGDSYVDESNSVKSALALYNGFIKAGEELLEYMKDSLKNI